MQNRLSQLLVAALLLFAVVPTAGAQQLDPKQVPPALEPWVDFVMSPERDAGCRSVAGTTVCLWPGLLALKVTATGATFSQNIVANTKQTVALPGSKEHWPQEVKIGTKPAVVFETAGTPTIEVLAGEHEISGRFFWRTSPDAFVIPERTGLFSLEVAGKVVPFPDRDGGRVRIEAPELDEAPTVVGPDQVKEPEPERLSLQVSRRIEDGAPVRVTTHLRLRVSGKAREVNLGQPLPAGVVPLSIESPGVPMQLDDEGNLLVQVRPGTWVAKIHARVATPPKELTAPKLEEPWPSDEVWVWSPNAEFRQVELSGPPAIDPTRTEIPDDWKQLTAYRLGPGAKLGFATKRRGVPDPPPNELRLNRVVWLDYDGGGWNVRDDIAGEMHEGWRLDLLKGSLGHVTYEGESRFITTAEDKTGVELRKAEVDVRAEWRLPRSGGTLPAAGWSEDFKRSNIQVNLPAGWELLYVSGAERANTLWIERWGVMDALIILILSAILWKLAGMRMALLGAAALTLAQTHTEQQYLWWLALLGAIGLSRVLRAGVLRSLVRGATAIVAFGLAVVVANYASGELSFAAQPESERHRSPAMFAQAEQDAKEGGTGTRAKGESGSMGRPTGGETNRRYAVRGPAPEDEPDLERAEGKHDLAKAGGKARARKQAMEEAAEFGMIGLLSDGATGDPTSSVWANKKIQDQVVQTGEGMPTWDARSFYLEVGSVKADHEVSLVLLPPIVTRPLAVLRGALLALLALLLIRTLVRTPPRVKPTEAKPATAAAAAAALFVCLWPAPAAAQTPSTELLEQLKEKLTATPKLVPTPDCGNDCVSVSRLTGRITGRTLELEAEVHLAGPSVYKLPGPAKSWVPASIRVDGKPTGAVALLEDGSLYLRLEKGRSVVTMTGPIGGTDLTLDAGTEPKRVSFSGKNWVVDGVDDNGKLSGSLRLRAEAGADLGDEGDTPTAAPSQELPLWLGVTRRLDIGTTWTTTTTVERHSAGSAPALVRIPLLPGEEITTDGIRVEKRHAIVTLSPPGRASTKHPNRVSWTSILDDEKKKIALAAPKDGSWTERWTVRCSPIWQCAFDGVAPVAHESDNQWSPTYTPWPGDKISVALTRPAGAPGRSLTVDGAEVRWEVEPRRAVGTLTLATRTSTIGKQLIELPAGAREIKVAVDGSSIPTEEGQRSLEIPLQPGRHSIRVEWEIDEAIGLVARAPEVKVAGGAVDVQTSIRTPSDRVRILSGGPGHGPTVLLLAYLLLLAAAGFAISRLSPRGPVRSWEWALLGAGLTQAPFPFVAAIPGWFLAMKARSDLGRDTSALRKNLIQIGIVLLTLVALVVLLEVLRRGLDKRPDSFVLLGGSDWYVDRSGKALPRPWMVTLPRTVWMALNGVWLAWLAWSFRQWGPWAWKAFTSGGVFDKLVLKPKPMAPAAAGPVQAAVPTDAVAGVPATGGGSETSAASDPAEPAPAPEEPESSGDPKPPSTEGDESPEDDEPDRD